MKGGTLAVLLVVVVGTLLASWIFQLVAPSLYSREVLPSAVVAQPVQPAEGLPEGSTMRVWYDRARCVTCYILVVKSRDVAWETEMSCLPRNHLCPVE